MLLLLLMITPLNLAHNGNYRLIKVHYWRIAAQFGRNMTVILQRTNMTTLWQN